MSLHLLPSTGSRFSSAVMKVNYPIHNNAANPVHGKFFIVGSVPLACYDKDRNGGLGGSKFYDTEQDALDALVDAGATCIQRLDCSIYQP